MRRLSNAFPRLSARADHFRHTGVTALAYMHLERYFPQDGGLQSSGQRVKLFAGPKDRIGSARVGRKEMRHIQHESQNLV